MNGSWSDASDQSGELDLINPGSQSGASEEEFESSDEADNDEVDEDPVENSNEPNINQHQDRSREEGDDNIEVDDEALDNSGETLVSLDEDLAGEDGSKPGHGVINMHHVDMILDNIDAELHNIINRSMTSEASEQSYQSGQPRTQQTMGQEIQTPESLSEDSNDDTTADEEEQDDNGSDTGLGTGSLPGDSSLLPSMDHTQQSKGMFQMNGMAKTPRENSRLNNKRSQRNPHRKPIVEFSDVDSICSEDIRLRMEETLNLQDSDTNTLPTRHTHNPSFTHDARPQYSTPRYSTHSPHETPRGELTEMNSDHSKVATKEDSDHEEITSRIKEIVSMALSESASAESSSDSTQVLGHPHHHQRTKEIRNSNLKSKTVSSSAPTSQSFLEHRRAGRGFDMDSIATEDFEHYFHTSIIRPESSSSNIRNSPKKHAAAEKSSHPVRNETVKPSPSLKDTDRLMVPRHGKRGKSRHRKRRTVTVPTSKPSGLPEYMYLRKEVTESDLGSDSIKTEEYEGHFEVAKVIDYHSTPKYAKESKLPKRLRPHNVQSDPESIQTEEYEQRFRSLMVKHVAGVLVKSFDQVSVQSDLESVETGMVHQKFQEALQKGDNQGPEVKVFNEYGDQSDVDPMQREELEQKFQAVLKQKKKNKKRFTQRDTDEDGTSDVDSVRAIPSKSEAGSPPSRRGSKGRNQAQRLLNGGRQNHHSRDPSPRSSAYVSSRSTPRVSSSPVRPQPASPWNTSPDLSSPSPLQRSPTLQQGVHPQFAFAPQLQGKPCGNHEKAAQRPGQANHPSWQDPSLGRQRAAAWNAQHQDSFSTYEEVESLHSHQCSSLQSLDNSCGPSRLQSFGSSSSSLDQSLQQIDGESPFTSGVHIPIDQDDSSYSRDDQGSSLESDSTNSVSVDGRRPVHLPTKTRSGHLPEKSRRSLIDEDEEEMNASVAKWVDQTRAETARRRSNVGLPEDPQMRSHEAPDGGNKPHDVTKERLLTALNMQCGDVIAGRSGSRVRLPNETDLELALRVGNPSPVNSVSRGASIDGSISSSAGGEDHPKTEGEWTLAENVLIDLGFAGSNMGIPDRFLRSWKEQVLKQRVEEVRRLLGNSSGNYLFQHLPPKPGNSTPPTEKLSFVPSKNLTAGPRTHQSYPLAAQPSEHLNSSQPEDAVLNRQQGADRSKLIGLRRSLKKAATVSSFGQTLSEIGKQSQPSQHVLAPQHTPDLNPASRRSQGGQKYSPLHKNHKSSARDRRRKYMKKQTSLPSSLEPLLEEDESSKPGMVKSKQIHVNKEAPAGMQHLTPHSFEMDDKAAFPCKLKIVMEQPSIESREAMSRQGTTDVDVDEAIGDVDIDKTPKVTMEQYLVVKAIIDSKDSGFENGPSRNGSPQMSPRSSEDETTKSMDARIKTTANSGQLRRTKSSDSDSAVDRLLAIISPKQTKSSHIPAPLSFSIKPFHTQHNKQHPNRSDLPTRSVKPNPESSNLAAPVSSDVAVEHDFSQTTVEGEDASLGNPSHGETVSCQTSPNLHSPLLSPLFFLDSISEHPDGVLDTDLNCSLQVFVMPDGAEESLSQAPGRSDSLESVMTTADGFTKGTSQENKSQEISDGGLSIIAEKEEPCHEPPSQVGEIEPQKLLSPIIKADEEKPDVASQHLFDEPQHDSNTMENLQSIQIPSYTNDKSRNPFKETKDFYTSHHSDFDFDATIEEDEDGEQYSDGESFSKVTFSETPTMLSTFSVSSGSEFKERSQDLESQDQFCHQVENDKKNMQEKAMKDTKYLIDEPAVTVNDNIALQFENSGAREHNTLEKDQEQFSSEALKIIHGNCIDDVIQYKQQNLEIMPQGTEKSPSVTNSNESESKDDRQYDYTRHSRGNHHSNPNAGIDAAEIQISSHIGRHVKASDCDCNASGNDLQIANDMNEDKNTNDEEHLLSTAVKGNTPDTESSKIYPDCLIVEEDINNCVDSAATKFQNIPSVGFEADKADVVRENFLAFVPGDKAEFPDPLPAVMNQLEGWNFGFDQPAIIRSTSLEANMNYQRKKLRTLSERNTLYSDGMEPLLAGFGRVVTERSNASTEGFGSFGSDVFHRPLTVKQTLQQVASKLECLVRQRSLVSIQDQETEEDVKVQQRRTASLEESNKEMPTHSRKILTDFDPRDRRKKVLSGDRTKYSPLQEDEGYEEVNSIDESIVDVNGTEKNETNSSNVTQNKTAQIDGRSVSSKSPSHHNVSRETKTPTEEIFTQNMKTHSIDQNGSSTVEIQTSVTKPPPAITDKSKKRKNWQRQTSSGRRSSNFLTVPSFGSLNDSVDLISDDSSADQLRSVWHSLGGNGITPMIKQRLGRNKLPRESKNYLVSSLSDDSNGSSIALNVGAEDSYESSEDHLYTVNNPNEDVEYLKKSRGDTGSECESNVDVFVVDNSSVPLKDARTKDHPVMKSSQSVSSSSENKEGTLQVYDKNATQELNSNNMISVFVNSDQNLHIQSDDKPDETSNCVFIRLQPPNGMKRSIHGTVAHSQFVRCEKYLDVATSSNGKVDFIESDDASRCKSHQVPTFLSEVQFLPRSDSSKRSSFQISDDSPSQASVSLDCPSPVSSSRLSPTFEEICNKAGHLMLQLQDALATRASPAVETFSPVKEKKCEDAFPIEEEDFVEAGEEEEEEQAAEFGSRDKNEPLYSKDEDGIDMQHEVSRTKPGGKKKKKRAIRENSIKTSTPKANPGRHQDNGSVEFQDRHEGPSGNNNMATIKELLATETKMKRKLDELESSFEEISTKKQVALSDLKNLREAVHRNKRDIQKAEEITRDSMERADGMRSELMVLEYQRDQARRELQDLEQSIDTVSQPKGSSVPEEEKNGLDNNNSLMGFSPKEVIAVMKERDELKMRVRNGEGDLSPIERSELERQLSSTKQELFNGQKSSRARMDSLQEELEESRHNVEDLLNQKANLSEKVKELQTLFISEHQDQRELHVEERNKLLEQLNGKLQKEVETLRQQLQDKDQHLHQVSATVAEKDKITEALGEKILGMQREAEEEGKGVEKTLKEMEAKVRNADVVKELAMVELREALLKEKDQDIENLKLSMEKEKREALAVQDEKTFELMMITKRSLTEREEDLRAVKSQLVQQTEEALKMEQQLKEQTEDKIKSAVKKERQERDEEYTRRRREEMREKELEVAKETARLQGELHVAHQRHEHLQTTVTVLKEELDKVREENLAAGREKVEAVSEAREKARDEIQRELDQLREQLATENLLEMDKLRHKLRQQEEELTKLRSEVKVHQDKEATMSSLTKSKSILAEINEECRRTAVVIGTTPIKLNISSIKGNKTLNGTMSPKTPFASTPNSTRSPGRTQIVAALTNLRISNEELRNYVQTQKSELERQKRALTKAQKEKDEDLKKVANTIEKKSEDMDTMRDRLIQDHLAQVEELQQQTSRLRTTEGALQERLLDKDSELREIQQSMTQWKEETALKMAKKFEEELSRELEIRLQEQISKRDGSSFRGSQTDLRSRHSSGNVSPSTNSSASEASTIRLLKHLQERVKQLRTENLSLRRSSRGPLDTSGEDRGSLHSSRSTGSNDKDHLLYQLQQKVKLLERQLQVAEERCRENAISASEKSSENSRLQGALTQQTKELMKMERAYSKLATPPPRTPVRL